MCDDDDNCCSPPVCIGGCIAFVGVLLICILVPMHFSYIDLNNIGFQKERTSGTVDTSKAYGTGRYGWGVTKTSTQFKSTWYSVRFTGRNRVVVFTDSGEITVGVSFYYVLTKDHLASVFDNFAKEYDNRIRTIALDNVKSAAANFTTTQYQEQRWNVTNGLYTTLAEALLRITNVTVPREGFFLEDIQLPTTVLNKRVDVFVNAQQQITQTFELRSQQERQATAQNVSRINQLTDVARSEADQIGAARRNTAKNQARSAIQSEVGAQLRNMVSSLGIAANANATRQLVRFNTLLDGRSTTRTILDGVFASLLARYPTTP